MKTKNLLILLVFAFILSSCEYFEEDRSDNVIARVNDHFLTLEELNENLPKQISTEDSAVFAKNFIRNWATDKLLLDRAKLNLPEEQQTHFRNLAQKYKEQLFKKAYKDAIIERELEGEIDSASIAEYYEKNKTNFKLNEDLIKLRYLQVDKKINGFKNIKEKFRRFNAEDKKELDSRILEFKSMILNDSTWVRSAVIIDEFSKKDSLNIRTDAFFKSDNFIELETENGNDVFLIFVKDVLKRNSEAPLSYVKPTIEQILLNKKKTEVSKNIEKEITKDATKNNEFEVY
ncbi:hypothetical protein [Psychroflexus aestuariivivens]|uniref:hypothetical protein n=1 Tax=Psychroflexus aestuariivivens TaxID=1795040 RepID=UPI000FD73303|nr:hypothetical protein [Psychroflexus aestuariivivens]